MHAEVTLAHVAAASDIERWHTTKLKSAQLRSYGNRASKATIPLPTLSSNCRTTSVHCPGLDAPVEIPVNEQRRAKQVYGKLWGKSHTVTSLICVDFGHAHEVEAEELDAFLDCNRPDNKAKDRRKCEICGHVGHNRATCPNMAPADAVQNLPSTQIARGD
eukprot:jgi/Tetstr1/464948/TSEL_009682.t1